MIRRMRFLLTLAFGLVWLGWGAPAGAETEFPAAPAKKWRVAYVEGGNFKDYYLTMVGLAHGLEKLGLIANGRVPVVENSEDTGQIWSWLAAEAGGDRLEFLADGYYSANWDDDERIRVKERVLERLRTRGDVDLILATGTWAGIDLATDEHRVPVMSNNVTSPVLAGISASITDSGRDHVHVQVEADRLQRQVRIFYDFFNFRRLGVPMDSTVSGRQSLGIDIIEEMSRELGFQIVPCVRDLEIPDGELSFKNLMECVDILAKDSDAIFLTFNNGMQTDRLAEILAPIVRHKRPSFSQSGPDDTALGVLLSLGQDNYDASGEFEAQVIKQILEGRQPREINQIFDSPLTLALNLAMAQAIGWKPPFEILVGFDEIYQTMVVAP